MAFSGFTRSREADEGDEGKRDEEHHLLARNIAKAAHAPNHIRFHALLPWLKKLSSEMALLAK